MWAQRAEPAPTRGLQAQMAHGAREQKMNVQAYRRAGLAQDFGGLLGPIRALRAHVEDWARRREAYLETLAELQSLSDRELDDIGLHRLDLPRVAREAAALS